MIYENSIIQCANDRLQIYCQNHETDEYIKIDETREDVLNLYFVLRHFFESYEANGPKILFKGDDKRDENIK